LPPGSEKPVFSRYDDPVVKRHFENGYGIYS